MHTPDLHARLLAILAADVSGYSRLMSLDDKATVIALDAGRAVFREHIAAHGGRVIDMSGDSVLSVFGTATGAVAAALAIQQHLSGSADGVPEERRMRFRIGIHVGDVIERDDGTVYGDGVNIDKRRMSSLGKAAFTCNRLGGRSEGPAQRRAFESRCRKRQRVEGSSQGNRSGRATVSGAEGPLVLW